MSADVSQALDWWNPAATLVATFGGIFVAFALERRQRNREEVERQLSASRRAIFVLSDMWNVVVQFQKDIVEPNLNRDDAWLNMEVSNFASWKPMKFDCSSLAFILDTEYAQSFAELLMEERRFEDLFRTVAERDKIINQRVFPALGAIMPVGAQIDNVRFAQLLGHHTEHQLRILTAGILRQSDDLSKSLPVAQNKFRDVIAKIHPERGLLKFMLDA